MTHCFDPLQVARQQTRVHNTRYNRIINRGSKSNIPRVPTCFFKSISSQVKQLFRKMHYLDKIYNIPIKRYYFV